MVYLKVAFRIISIMVFVLILILVTGRRKVGELPVFDFLSIIILGNIVGADIADPKIPQLPTAFAVFLLVIMQYLISHFTIKSRKFGDKVTFEPVIVIQNGQIIKANMKKVRYSIENILMFLREKGIFDLNEVEFAIIEDSGNLSVMKKSQFQPLTPSDMKISTNYKGLTIPLILDGRLYADNLKKLKLDEAWLKEQLAKYNINSFEEAFYADINTEGTLYASKMMEEESFTKKFKIE